MAFYIFNVSDASQATALLRARVWGVDVEEPHRDALAPGDVALIYLAAPEQKLIAHAELASHVHEWTPSERQVYPGDFSGGVLLAHVDAWEPPVAMDSVLSQIDQSAGARAEFENGVVQITSSEYQTALAVRRASS